MATTSELPIALNTPPVGLSTVFIGTQVFLDGTLPDGQPVTLTTFSATPVPTSTAFNSIPTSTSTSTPTSSQDPAAASLKTIIRTEGASLVTVTAAASSTGTGPPSGSNELSSSAKAGLGVGIGIGVPLLIGDVVLGWWLGRRRRRRLHQSQEPGIQVDPVGMGGGQNEIVEKDGEQRHEKDNDARRTEGAAVELATQDNDQSAKP